MIGKSLSCKVMEHLLCYCLQIFIEAQTETAVCRSDAECGPDECCVGLDRRRRFVLTRPTSGICRPMRFQGQACHVFFQLDPFNPNLHVHYCPCDTGLECRGTTIDGANSTQAVHHNPKCLPKGNSTRS